MLPIAWSSATSMADPMSLRRVERTWTHLGRENPMWAVLTYKRDWDEEEFFATGEQEITALAEDVEALGLRFGGERALDFGSGIGRLTKALASRFQEVVGVDISQPMVERARQLGLEGDGVSFVVNTRPDLSIFDADSFDLVYSNITLQHMPTDISEGYLREFVRVVRPGGLVAFQLPTGPREDVSQPNAVKRSALALRGLAGRAVRLGRRHMEMHWLPREAVEAILVDAGAQPIDARQDTGGGRRWESMRYVATKSRP